MFRVLRDLAQACELERVIRLTNFGRTEFREAYEPTDDPIERSRRLVVRAFMGFGSNAHESQDRGHRSTGFRANSSRSGTAPATDWKNWPDALAVTVERLQGFVIENRDASEVLAKHDSAASFHYVDPPTCRRTGRSATDTNSPGGCTGTT